MAATGWQEPVFEDDANVPFTAHGAIVKGTFVEVYTGSMIVQTAAANSMKVIGVSKETVADGDLVTVDLRGEVWKMVAEGAVTAGDQLGADSDGTGGVSTIAAASGTPVYGDINKARAVLAIALEDIADEASGRVLVI